jgi:carboxyl-terminal processing protease
MRSGVFMFLLLIITLFITTHGLTQTKATVGLKALRLTKVLSYTHFKPIKYDTLKSREIINQFIQTLDPTAIYFLKEDQQALIQYSDSLWFNIEKKSNLLIDEATTIYSKRLQQADSLIPTILNQPIDFQKNELLDVSEYGYKNYPKNYSTFIDNWRKVLKARLLHDLFLSGTDSVDRFSMSDDELLKFLPKSIEKVTLKSKWKIKKILEHPDGFDVNIQSAYLNAITLAYDPHSEYFTQNRKDKFEESLSSENESFGLSFIDNENGEIEISRISLGSPAWYADAFETGDVVLSIKPANKEEIDLTYLDSYELWEALSSGRNFIADFKVRKKDNKIVSHQLIKSEIESEIHARSFVLKGARTVGYIYLPSFYTSFEQIRGTGCALDIMREVIKLESEGVEGILLDLRQNSGGSINEAIGIASIFIDEGRLATLARRGLSFEHLERIVPGITNNKPLVVLVDIYSASAAEVLSGILQTYNRAVIVGSRTFGKFTGQVILPLNREMFNQNMYTDPEELGFAKITVEKTYMENGISYQGTGITPDVQLPFPFDDDKYREIGLKNALQLDSIETDKNFKPLSLLPIEMLTKKSADRITYNKIFQSILKSKDEFTKLKYLYDRINLDVDQYKIDHQIFKQFSVEYDKIKDYKITAFDIFNNQFDQDKIQFDNNEKDINEKIISNMKSDIYLEETFFILNDLIDSQVK